MSLSVAGMLDKGENPALEASVVKDLGAVFEQDMPVKAHELLGISPTIGGGNDYEEVLGYLTQTVPSFPQRGGTRASTLPGSPPSAAIIAAIFSGVGGATGSPSEWPRS